MSNSIAMSVVLPLHNQQSVVVERVEHVLDELSELCHQIQLIAIDDHSTDATGEILHDLSLKFPQLEVLHTGCRMGAKNAAQAAVSKAKGDFVFVQESYGELDFDALRQLWDLRGDDELVMAQVRTYRNEIDEELLNNLTSFAKEFERQFYNGSKDKPAKQESALAQATTTRTIEGQLQMLRRDSIATSTPPSPSHLEMQRRVKSSIV